MLLVIYLVVEEFGNDVGVAKFPILKTQPALGLCDTVQADFSSVGFAFSIMSKTEAA